MEDCLGYHLWILWFMLSHLDLLSFTCAHFVSPIYSFHLILNEWVGFTWSRLDSLGQWHGVSTRFAWGHLVSACSLGLGSPGFAWFPIGFADSHIVSDPRRGAGNLRAPTGSKHVTSVPQLVPSVHQPVPSEPQPVPNVPQRVPSVIQDFHPAPSLRQPAPSVFQPAPTCPKPALT